MGLDMYLTKRTYVKRWSHDAPEEKYSVLVKKGGKVVSKDIIDPEKISYVEQEVGYWRKANAIHNWFVKECAEGEDDCKDVEVSTEDLQKLLDSINQVVAVSKLVDGKIQNGSRATANGWEPIMQDGKYIANPKLAKKLLPTTDGFFFGGTAYDEYYYQSLIDTKTIILQALKDPKAWYTYCASW